MDKNLQIDEFAEDEHGFYLWQDARVGVSKKDGKIFFGGATVNPSASVFFAIKKNSILLNYGDSDSFHCGKYVYAEEAENWIKKCNSLIKEKHHCNLKKFWRTVKK